MARPTPQSAPAQPVITVPTVTAEEICAAATKLAERAKQRLLEGAAADGAELAGKAIDLAHAVGHAAVDELEKLEELCLRFAGKGEQAPMGSPPTEPSKVPPAA